MTVIYSGTEKKANDWLVAAEHDITVHAMQSVAWTPIPPKVLGPLPVGTAQEVSYDLPDSVPSSAHEILIYANVFSGFNHSLGAAPIEIYTQDGNTKYIKILALFRYTQAADAFNSENMWFPVTRVRKIFAKLNGPANGENEGGDLQLIGYR